MDKPAIATAILMTMKTRTKRIFVIATAVTKKYAKKRMRRCARERTAPALCLWQALRWVARKWRRRIMPDVLGGLHLKNLVGNDGGLGMAERRGAPVRTAEELRVKERPILMNAAMVRATLAGRKTQTRRIAKGTTGACEIWAGEKDNLWSVHRFGDPCNSMIKCPFGAPGDRLYVRETFAADGLIHGDWTSFLYRADHGELSPRAVDADFVDKWRPSIHMPRWASRITLEIIGVRVERLQDISEEDAIAEGMQMVGPAAITDRGSFALLWESIYGKGSWAANPFVWAVSFKRLEATS